MAGDSVRSLAAGPRGAGDRSGAALAGLAPRHERRAAIARASGAAAVAAGAILAVGIAAGEPRAWSAWLLASIGILTAGLGGLVFLAIQYAAGASWSVAFRRVPEALTAAIPAGGLALLALVLLRPDGYAWTLGGGAHGGEAAAFKHAWLSWPFFAARAAIYLAVWLVFARAIVRGSRQQDADADPAHSVRNVRRSIAFLAAFAVTFSLASFDWIMSLEPEWYSTIFGIYNFAGMFSSAIALLVVLVVWLRQGPLRHVVSDAHLHDLGKLLFAFSTFWMYIWFSQYMLIWYANIPEETSYYVLRTRGAYRVLFYANVALNWVAPFAVLLRRRPKTRPEIVVKVAVAVLLGRALDLYLMIVPPAAPDGPPFGLLELAGVVAMAGGIAWATLRAFGEAAPVPSHDPRLEQSLHYHS